MHHSKDAKNTFLCNENLYLTPSKLQKRQAEGSEGVRNDGYEERRGGGHKIVVECLQFCPKLGRIICQGSTPALESKVKGNI